LLSLDNVNSIDVKLLQSSNIASGIKLDVNDTVLRFLHDLNKFFPNSPNYVLNNCIFKLVKPVFSNALFPILSNATVSMFISFNCSQFLNAF